MVFRRHMSAFVLELLFTIGVIAFVCGRPARAQNCTTRLGSSPPVSGGLPGASNSFSNYPSGFVSAADVGDPWTIRKRVDEVTVFFTAAKGHKFVKDLTEQEISVKDDNKPPAKISAFGHQSDLPLRLGLLVDTSNSVHHRFNFEQEAASRFLEKIVRPQVDRAFVMGFSDHTNLTQGYTDDSAKLARRFFALRSDGGTALYDAVQAACTKLTSAVDDGPLARILVVLSDGDDNASKNPLEQVIESAQRQEVTIYTISTNNSGHLLPGDRILKELAVQSGGQMFAPDSAKGMVKAFTSIEKEMRSRYALSYQPSDLLEDGRFRRIEIVAQRFHKKLRVYARKGYYARPKPLRIFP